MKWYAKEARMSERRMNENRLRSLQQYIFIETAHEQNYTVIDRHTFKMKMPRLFNSNRTFRQRSFMRSYCFTNRSLWHLDFHCGNFYMEKRSLVPRASFEVTVVDTKFGQASTFTNGYNFSLLDSQVKRHWHTHQQTKIKDCLRASSFLILPMEASPLRWINK